MRIFKYELKFPTVRFAEIFQIPKDGVILSAQDQGGKICIWAAVEPDNEKEERAFVVLATGEYFNIKVVKYIATVQQGDFVWHICEVI